MANSNPNRQGLEKGHFKRGHLNTGAKRRRISDNLLLDLAKEDAKKLFDELKVVAYATDAKLKEMNLTWADKERAINKIIDKCIIVGKYSDYMESQSDQIILSPKELAHRCVAKGLATETISLILNLFYEIQEEKNQEQLSRNNLENDE